MSGRVGGMNERERRICPSKSGVVVRPPIAWALTAIAGLALDGSCPLPFLPAAAGRLARRRSCSSPASRC